MHNNWQTSCFLCPQYNSIIQRDDDWACDFEEYFFISDLPRFTDIHYKYSKKFDTWTNLYLIIKTTIIFKEALSKEFDKLDIPICVAFHDQTYITRLNKDR